MKSKGPSIEPCGTPAITPAIKSSSDKRSITATFSIPFSGKFLPIHLIYGGKTTKPLPRFKFRNDFSLSVSKTHYSNEKEACKLIEEILVSYIEKVRQEENPPVSQKALVIMDVFSFQITSVVLDCFKDSKIKVVCVPANMTLAAVTGSNSEWLC